MRKVQEDKGWAAQKPPLSDYDRTTLKIDKKKRLEKKAGSSIPQLGTQ
jgi:hypothetical protein